MCLSLLLFFGCKKTDQPVAKTETPAATFSVLDAKGWYASLPKGGMVSGRTSAKSKIRKFEPDWGTAKNSEDENYYIVESALNFDKTPGFSIHAASVKTDTSDINGNTKLLILKSKKTGAVKAVLMHIVSSNSTGEEVSYKPKNSHFSGFIFFTSFEGNYINGWQYENGIIIRRSKEEISPTNSGAKLLPPEEGEEECTTYETKWYERQCYEYYNGDYKCEEWVYIGSTYETYCTNTGGGGGGVVGEDDPPQDPCAEAKQLADAATNLSKNSNYITAKSSIQSAAADGNEHTVTFGKDANGNITVSSMTTGGSTSGNVNTSWPSAFADLHNHQNEQAPSPGDLYGLVSLNQGHGGWNTRFVVTESGSVYALVVVDLALASQFVLAYPKEQLTGYPPDFPNPIFDHFTDTKAY